MAIIQSPVIGRAKKTAGGMVFTTLNGQNIMKSKPFAYRDLNSIVQQGNRLFVSSMSKLAGSMKGYARGLFEKQPTDMPAFSKMQQQLLLSRIGTSGSYAFAPHGKEIGSGSISAPIASTEYAPLTGVLTLAWDSAADVEFKLTNSSVYALVVNKNTMKLIGMFEGSADFGSEEANFTLPTGLTPSQLSIALVCEGGSGAELVKSIKLWKDYTAA